MLVVLILASILMYFSNYVMDVLYVIKSINHSNRQYTDCRYMNVPKYVIVMITRIRDIIKNVATSDAAMSPPIPPPPPLSWF